MMDKSTQLTKSMSKISLRKGGGAKKICIGNLIDGALVGRKSLASAMDITTDIPKRSDDTEDITGATIEPQPKKRYRPRTLISTKEFDKLVQTRYIN